MVATDTPSLPHSGQSEPAEKASLPQKKAKIDPEEESLPAALAEDPAPTLPVDKSQNIRPVAGVHEIPSGKRSERKIARIPNLTDLAASHAQPVDSASSDEANEYYGEKPFTADALKAAWTEFAMARKKAGKDVEHAVLMQDYLLKDSHTIILQLTNSVKIPILDRFRSDLISHLKTRLDNRHISLETQLLEEEQSYRPYTSKEKFEYLVEKRPILRTLQEKLGLDPDL